MAKYVLKRLSLMLLTLWFVVTITFFLMHLLPGDPLKSEKISPEIRAIILKQYGLDKPLYIQYFKFLGGLLHGDLGKSMTMDGRDVLDMLMEGFPVSLQVGLQGLAFGLIVGVLLGIISALKHGSLLDNMATIFSVLGVSLPSFVTAPLLSYFVGVKWGILPPGLWESYKSSILPSLVLSFFVIAQIARYVRTEMIEVLDQDYIRTARAKGLKKTTIILRHALRNALIPAVTILGPLTINIVTGSLIVEQVFALPGMGELFVKAILTNDYTLIQGTTIFYSFLIIVAIFLVDIIYGLIDPRIRIAKA